MKNDNAHLHPIHIRPSSGRIMRPLRIVGAASCAGASRPGCEDGPDALAASGMLQHLAAHGIPLSWHATLYPEEGTESLAIIDDLCRRLSGEVESMARSGALPVVIGGDHSCAIGTWSGCFAAIRGQGSLGLVWIDAHMDSHTPQTTPSGAIHGMPLAVLLGHGERRLVDIGVPGPKLLPEHVCLVGIRSFEEGEAALLKRLGVRVFFMDEIKRRGIGPVMSEALAIAQRGTAAFGISIDLDAFSPGESPGVGTPVRDGLHHPELDRLLRGIGLHPGLAALELVEYNPLRDRHRRTLKLIGGSAGSSRTG